MGRAIDVSSYQGAFDFAGAKAAGVELVILRATMGHLDIDSELQRNLSAARAAGLRVGFYHFAYPGLNSAASESGHFLAVVKPYVKPGDIVALDFETAPFSEAWALDWLTTVEKALGFTPHFYSYLSAITGAHFSSALAKYPLWLADYTSVKPAAPAPWSKIAIWQAADNNGVPGKHVDLDWDYEVEVPAPKPKLPTYKWEVSYRKSTGERVTAGTRHPVRWAMGHPGAFRRGKVIFSRVVV